MPDASRGTRQRGSPTLGRYPSGGRPLARSPPLPPPLFREGEPSPSWAPLQGEPFGRFPFPSRTPDPSEPVLQGAGPLPHAHEAEHRSGVTWLTGPLPRDQ